MLFVASPDSAGLALCCLFSCSVLAWAVAALGALFFSARGRDILRIEDALVIGFIGCALIVALHLAPAPAAAALAAAIAAHAALIAVFVAADSFASPSADNTDPMRGAPDIDTDRALPLLRS